MNDQTTSPSAPKQTSSQKTNKNRKYGRNSASAKRYTAENRHIRNKIRRLKSHLNRQPNDLQSTKALLSIN